MTIRSITFVHDSTTYTCTVGEFITKETRRRAKTKREAQRLNDYMGPIKGFQPMTVKKIVDNGTVYLVHLDNTQDPHGWANPFMVGKHDTLKIAEH